MLAVALGLLANRERVRAIAGDVLESPALLFLSGLLALVAGMALVLAHNVWVGDWRLLLTVLGWATLLGGAARVIAPEQVRRLGTNFIERPAVVTAATALWLTAGLLLTYVGYVR
jgi:hypothetical protein